MREDVFVFWPEDREESAEMLIFATLDNDAGRPAPVSVRFEAPDGGPVTADAIRRIPLREVFQVMIERSNLWQSGWEQRERELEELANSPTTARSGDLRGRPLTDAHLREVAAVWRAASYRAEPTTQAVANAFDLPLSTAEKRVAAARRRGHLEEPAHRPMPLQRSSPRAGDD